MAARRLSFVALACAASLVPACFGAGLMTDLTSVSHGMVVDGALRDGAPLPWSGDGWEVPASWRGRRANYGTDELVDALIRCSRQVNREFPGSVVQFGDLSSRRGGFSPRHRSHQSGRDVDVFLLAADGRGRPLPPLDAMVPYAPDGRAKPWRDQRGVLRTAWGRNFDDARNWAFVRALLSDPGVEVQWIFLHETLARRLLAYASQKGEDRELLARAAAVLAPPSRGLPHDDHMHVRVFCDPADVPYGCTDIGPERWVKKHRKRTGTRALAELGALNAGRRGGLPDGLTRLALTPSSWRWW